jgi:predicted Fe-Mo cluster-binding NifX family protein
MKEAEYRFCMKQFRPAIAGLAILVVVVLGWSGWHCSRGKGRPLEFLLAAASAPAAKRIDVRDKMPHPYWGNCNMCHVTVGAGKPVSKVMASVPISIKDKMPHKYWGNCLLCHKVTDGFQPKEKPLQARAAALKRVTAQSLGLKIQTVTGATMREFGLVKEDGTLVLEVAPHSIAAEAGMRKGDEIVRVGRVRVESAKTFEAALNKVKPGSKVKINIYRGKKSRNLIARIPENFSGNLNPAAATTPMTQNQVETLAGQLGAPKAQQGVGQSPGMQKHGQLPANLNYGKVAVAAVGPGLDYQVAPHFGASPYFVVYDPGQNTYRVVANPNANDAMGKGIQTGQYVVDLGASNVVAGTFGQNALHTLRTLRVNVFSGVTGSVRDVLSFYMAGKLAPATTELNLRVARPTRNAPPGVGSQNLQPIY